MIRNLDLLKGEQNCWPKRDYSKINLGIARFEPLSNRGPPPRQKKTLKITKDLKDIKFKVTLNDAINLWLEVDAKKPMVRHWSKRMSK